MARIQVKKPSNIEKIEAATYCTVRKDKNEPKGNTPLASAKKAKEMTETEWMKWQNEHIMEKEKDESIDLPDDSVEITEETKIDDDTDPGEEVVGFKMDLSRYFRFIGVYLFLI